jgi:predicted Zn-dependent protease
MNPLRSLPGTLVAALALAACAINPVTGKRELVLISEQQEIEMGRQGAADVVQSVGLVPDSALQGYVQGIGADLARVSQRPGLPWQFRVVDDPTPNAFALPGGFIFVTRGLMDMMTNEAQLATVVGHEIGHVTARHQVRALTRAELAQAGLALGSMLSSTIARYGQLAGTGLQLLFLKYDRAAESQADQLGFRYAFDDHYDVRQMADVFQTLDRYVERQGASPLPSWLETHPSGPDRIAAVERRVAALDDSVRNLTVRRAEYLRRVDGLVYGADPRAGYFAGDRFLHPALRFQLVFPQGWQKQNLPEAVLGASPDQSAALELTVVDSGPAATAMRGFAAGQGIQVAGTSSQALNGVPAVSGTFQAQTDQGAVAGLVTFLDYGGHTFRLLGYTPAGSLETYRAALEQALRSFAPLTDPAILNVQPRRVRLVTTDRAMTLASFNTRYPSTIPVEELAIINQLPGGEATIPAGTILKRVVGSSPPGS